MKRIQILRVILFSLMYTVALQQLFAQGNGQHETVNVVGTYTPQLSEARKIGFTPEIKDTIIPVPPMNYKIISAPVTAPVEVMPVPPAKMVGETFSKLYKNHLVAGFGNYTSPLLDFRHHSYRNKKLRGEIHLNHHSASGKLKDYAYPGFSRNNAGLSGHFIRSEYTFSTGADYIREGVRYYGFLQDSLTPEFDKKDIRQVFHLFDFFVKGESNFDRKTAFHNSFGLKYQGLWDQFETSEHNAYLNGSLKKFLQIAGFLKEEKIVIEATGGFFSQNYPKHSVSTGLATVKPYLNFQLDEMEFTIGGTLCAQLDSIGDVLLLPYGRLDIHIVPNTLNIFLGIDGTAERNTFRSFMTVNPFIHTEIIPMDYTITKNILFGGVTGGFGGKFNYRLMAKNRKIQNMPLFVNDTLPFLSDTTVLATGNRFTAVYDNVDILTLSAEIQMGFGEKIITELKGSYHIFSPETQAKAWHMPRYEGVLSVTYNIADKIYGRLNVFAFGDRYALSGDAEMKLKPVYDFNLEAEYRYTKFLSAWVRINNFTTQRHFLWYNYPTHGLNAMLGVSYTF
jgi:hypothetical protein